MSEIKQSYCVGGTTFVVITVNPTSYWKRSILEIKERIKIITFTM